MSSVPSPSITSAAATSSAATGSITSNSNLKIVGIILAIASGLLIGSSFVFKKKGLLRSQAGGELGEGVAYLKSALWWLGMSMMILGELCNFAAYAFVEAIVVTPLGALSVVVCAILSSIFLQEKLSFFGWLGCGLCILGSVIIALNGPQEASVGQIREFQKLFLSVGFLVYAGLLIASALLIIFYFAPRYGKTSMLYYILVCSMIGGISVSVTTGLGAAIVETARGDNQFKFWFMYFLFGFVAVTLITEVYYLNRALALFNTAMVTPTYYVIFTFFSMLTTIVLFKGLRAPVTQIITMIMGFLVICLGIIILQMSKVDPTSLNKLDRRSTILLQAARAQTENFEEKGAMGIEDPGMDALRGSFGTVGSIIRARTVKRMSQRMSQASGTNFRNRPSATIAFDAPGRDSLATDNQLGGMMRHQLYDAPVPRADDSSTHSVRTKRPTIKFDSQDVVHSYARPGTGDNAATHEHRLAVGSPRTTDGYPPLPPPLPELSEPENSLIDSEPYSALPLPSGNDSHQFASVPPRIQIEPEVQSAPATIYSRFARAISPSRPDVRATSDTPSSGRGTLLSFPSVTDSALSQAWDSQEVLRQEAAKSRDKERGRTVTDKRYPKGAGDDDQEESVSLWQHSVDSDDNESLSPDPIGGIRLVQPGGSRKPF